jgi:hypothetical protein
VRQLADGRKGGRGLGGAIFYDSEKAWSSINHSILSAIAALLRSKHKKVLSLISAVSLKAGRKCIRV